MNNLNYEFLEEYKRLDKLCREMYLSEKGVTAYIDDMKTVLSYERRSVKNWDADLNKLIELRHVRNQLSHEIGTLKNTMCSQEDVLWLKNFYNRVISQTDPLSIYNKSKNSSNFEKRNYKNSTPLVSHQPQRNAGCLTSIVIFTLFTIFASILIFHLF